MAPRMATWRLNWSAIVYRLERKKVVRCVKRISNANIFEAVVPRKDAQGRLINELLALLGGRANLIMEHLVESGDLTLDDIKEVERTLRRAATKDESLCSQSTSRC